MASHSAVLFSASSWAGVLPDLRVSGALPRVLSCGLLGCGNATLCMVATLWQTNAHAQQWHQENSSSPNMVQS